MDKHSEHLKTAEEERILIYRRMTPVDRLNEAIKLGNFARQVCYAGLKNRHPAWSEEQLRKEVIRTFINAYDR